MIGRLRRRGPGRSAAVAGRWRRALVTGASSGLGMAFAEQLAAVGVDLVLVGRNREALEALASRLSGPVPGSGRRSASGSAGVAVAVEVLVADLADPADLARVAARLAAVEAPVDLLVNNAGYGQVGPFVELDVDDESAVVAVNVVALHRLSHAAGAAMAARGGGTILNVSSVAGFRPAARAATYGATKSFVTGFSQALAAELAPQGVTVSCLCPGLTRTEFHRRAGIDTSSYPRWAWMSAGAVAATGLRGAAGGKVTVVPGLHNQAAGFAMKLAPSSLLRLVDGRVRPGTRSPDH